MGKLRPTSEQKLSELLAKATKTGECLICHVAPNAKGYCYISLGRNNKHRAHRFVYETLNGKLPTELIVMHSCDNRACILPEHLSAGTVQDNQTDMKNKGRGRNKPRAVNRDANEQAIKLYQAGYTFREIAEATEVGTSTASYRVKRAKELGLWAHRQNT